MSDRNNKVTGNKVTGNKVAGSKVTRRDGKTYEERSVQTANDGGRLIGVELFSKNQKNKSKK